MCQSAIWDEFPELETRRLLLRQITPGDTEELFSLFSDDEVTEYMDIPSLTHIVQMEHLLLSMFERWDEQQSIRWGIVTKHNNALVGTCGYNEWVREYGYRGEIGYELMKRYWGQGIMSEALRAIIAYGFEWMQLNRIQAMVTPGNDRSINLLRKLGFQYEGMLREYGYWKGRFWDLHSLSLLYSEWSAHQA